MKKFIYTLLIISGAFSGLQAQIPAPAGPQTEPIMLKGATAHLGNGEVIENSVIAFKDGKLTVVGTSGDESGYTVIDVTGKHIYPGFILPNSSLGLEEVSSVRAMSDVSEQGDFNPNVRAQIAYNTDSENMSVFRFNGILLAESRPTGGVISGTSSIMQLDAWNWQDATYMADAAVHMNWPGRERRNFDFNTFSVTFGPNPNYDEEVRAIEKMMNDSKSYSELAKKDKNLKLEAMLGLFDGSKLLMIHVNNAKSAIESIKFAQSMGVQRIAVEGGTDLIMIAEFLADNEIPVVVPSIHDTPDRSDDDYDLPYRIAADLSAKGVQVSLSHSGMLGLSRNLPFYAGTSVAHGMDKEEALKTITSNTAKMLGIYDRTGSLEVGKDANLFVSEGDALDMKGNDLSHAFIQGRQITLEGRQQILYQKFSEKYGH